MPIETKWAHDPAYWNERFEVGVRVVRVDDLGRGHLTRTRSKAWSLGGTAVIQTDDRAGGYALSRIIPVEGGDDD